MKQRTYIAIDLKSYGISGRGRLFEVKQPHQVSKRRAAARRAGMEAEQAKLDQEAGFRKRHLPSRRSTASTPSSS